MRVKPRGDMQTAWRREIRRGAEWREEEETGLLLLRRETVQPICMLMEWPMERETDDAGEGKLQERR